jgi:hypothetical protein
MLKIIGDSSTSGATFDIQISTRNVQECLDGEGGIKTTSVYSKQTFENYDNSFSGINRFWATLPEEKQEAIFDCYSEIFYYLSTTTLNPGIEMRTDDKRVEPTQRRRTEFVRRLKELEALNDYDAYMRFAKLDEPVAIPADIKDEVPVRYQNQPREKTYVTDEYVSLVRFARYYKFLFPVIIMLGDNLRGAQIGVDEKELMMYRQLSVLKILTRPEAKRLGDYVESHFLDREQEFNNSLILNHHSREDMPIIVKARLFTKGMCIAETEPSEEKSVIATMSREIHKRLTAMDSKFNGDIVRHKAPLKNQDGEDRNLSMMESYRLKTIVSSTAKAATNRYSRNTEALLKRWVKEEDLPKALALADQTAQAIRNRDLIPLDNPVWENLAPGILWRCGVNHNISVYTKYEAWVSQFAAVIVILHYTGHDEVALMMCNDKTLMSKNEIAPSYLIQSAFLILEKQTIADLTRLYPYYEHENKPRATGNVFALTAIDEMTKKLCNYTFKANGPRWLLDTLEYSVGDEYYLPSDTKQVFANVMLTIHNHKPLLTKEELFYQEFPEYNPY